MALSLTWRLAPRRCFNGQTSGRIVFARDITKHKREQHALRESEERFRLVVEDAPIGMYIQTDGVFRYLNPAALTMFGAESVDQMIGQRFWTEFTQTAALL